MITKPINMGRCNNCGAELTEGVRFCGQCGNPVSENTNSLEQESYTTVQTESTLTDEEQPAQNQEYETNAAVELENNGGASKRSGIEVLAIVLCSIALLLVVALIVLKVVQNSKPKYRIVNQVKTVQSTPQTKNRTKSVAEEAIDLVKKWDAIHNSKKAGGFTSIYASQVKYYQQTYTPQQIIKSKQDLFDKTPEFQQSVSNFNVSGNIDGSIKVHFDKLVQTSAKKGKKTYPSYLVVKNINGNWLIIEESDDVTDENLAKKKNGGVKNANGQNVKSGKTCFISGLNNWKLYNLNGGDYIYEDGRKLEVSLFYNQSYLDCEITDESGYREFTGVLFNEVGWEPEESGTDDGDISFESGKNEYVIGQHDFDSDGIDELVIAMRCPDQNFVYGFGIIIYRVYDRKMWRFECPYVYGEIRANIINNIIRVPKNHRDFYYEYAFENGDFVDRTNFK